MGYGGPVWHASVKAHRSALPADELERYCRWGLDNCGDAEAGEWAEYHDRYFHLRRRLSPAEQELVGPVVDVRGTPEAERRMKPYLHLLPEGWTE